MESSRTKLAHHSRGRILRMPNDQDKICGSCLFILTEEGLARRKIRVFFRGFELEENGAACNLLSAGRLISILDRSKPQHRIEKFSLPFLTTFFLAPFPRRAFLNHGLRRRQSRN